MTASVAVIFWSVALYSTHMALLSCRAEAAGAKISECGQVVSVNPATLAAAVKGTGCKTLVLAAGTYARLNISGRPNGVLTLRCAVQRRCLVGTGSVVSKVNGLIIDGIQISGGSQGLSINGGSKNVLVRRSAFIEQTSAGITVGPGTQNDNIQIHDNEFRNAKRGCQYGTRNCTGRLSDGSPVAEMDYGVRVYDTKLVEIKGNRFGTMFNHAVSLKYSVVSAVVANNIFNSCGRNCVELGQESPACGEATATGNIFQGSRLVDVYIKNIRKAVVTGNTFVAAKAAFRTGAGPAGRRIVQTPNTYR